MRGKKTCGCVPGSLQTTISLEKNHNLEIKHTFLKRGKTEFSCDVKIQYPTLANKKWILFPLKLSLCKSRFQNIFYSMIIHSFLSLQPDMVCYDMIIGNREIDENKKLKRLFLLKPLSNGDFYEKFSLHTIALKSSFEE